VHCKAILDIPADYLLSPFEILGLKENLLINEEELRAKFYDLSKKLHPDRFATSPPPAPQYALRWTIALNRAYKILKAKEQRTQWLIEKHLGASSPEKKSDIPTDLAETYFEAQDLLSEGNLEPLLAFKTELESQLCKNQSQWTELAHQFDSAQEKISAAQALKAHENREKYLRSMLSDLERRVNS
jgi:molecular chaperone HscB